MIKLGAAQRAALEHMAEREGGTCRSLTGFTRRSGDWKTYRKGEAVAVLDSLVRLHMAERISGTYYPVYGITKAGREAIAPEPEPEGEPIETWKSLGSTDLTRIVAHQCRIPQEAADQIVAEAIDSKDGKRQFAIKSELMVVIGRVYTRYDIWRVLAGDGRYELHHLETR